MATAATPAPTAAAPDSERRAAIILAAPAALLLLALFIVPLVLLLAVSVRGANGGLSLAAYGKLFGDPYYLQVIWNSFRLALLTTIFALLIGYPAAFAIGRARGPLRSVLLAMLFLPLAASVIVKTFAWTILLRGDGVINTILMELGIIEDPIRMIFTETALVVGSVNVFLPFMILPIYTVVAMLDPRLPDAASTLGASPVVSFIGVTLPLTVPGIVAGVALVFSLSISAYVVPSLLIGERYPTLSTTIAKAYLLAREPVFGAAAGVVLLSIAVLTVVLSSLAGGRRKAAR